MRTIEDILADMQALMDASKGRRMTAEEKTSFTNFEAELASVQEEEGMRARHLANVSPAGPTPRVGARRAKPEETVEAAFNHFLRTGQPNADIAHLKVNAAQMAAYKIDNAQGEGYGPAGGYLVPTTFQKKIVERQKAFGGIANHVETIQTSDGAPIEWPTLDDTANSGEIVPESNTMQGGADIVLGIGQLGAYKYMAGGAGGLPIRVSVELVQDSAFDIEGLVSRILGQRIAREQAPDLIKGSGVGEPLGLVTGRTPVQTAANTGSITYDDLINWIHSVDPAYRGLGNCKWAFNDASMGVIEKMKDSHGDPLFRPTEAGFSGDYTAGMLLKYPVVIDQSFDNFVVNDSTKLFGAFGDFKEGYVRRLVKDVVVVVNPYTRMSYGEVEYTAWARMGATQINPNAYSVLSGKS